MITVLLDIRLLLELRRHATAFSQSSPLGHTIISTLSSLYLASGFYFLIVMLYVFVYHKNR